MFNRRKGYLLATCKKVDRKLAQQEEEHLKNEYKYEANGKTKLSKKTTEEKLDKLNMLPIKNEILK